MQIAQHNSTNSRLSASSFEVEDCEVEGVHPSVFSAFRVEFSTFLVELPSCLDGSGKELPALPVGEMIRTNRRIRFSNALNNVS